jgi:cyclopropane-fatty-acyl-phospholipid synthase
VGLETDACSPAFFDAGGQAMNSTTKPSIIPDTIAEADTGRPGLLSRLARRLLCERLGRLQDGEIRLQEGSQMLRFGARTARCGLSVTLTVRDPEFWSLAAFGGTVGAGESYINGHWRCDDLTGLVRIMVVNRHVMEEMEGGLAARGSALVRRLLHWANRNSRHGSARNIAAHYDLGNDLYRLMLDDTMAYSCGIFLREDATLHEASIAKFDAVCRKLALTGSDHLVEIGTGWGGLAIHAAEQYGCRVTTTTISREQHDFAKEKIAARGLSDRITLLFEDYRDLKGQFDKLVSIEMIEAVGAKYLDTYFSKCSSLLKPTGAMLLQAITLQDQFYAQALKSVDYIQRFVFPGSFIPSVSAIGDSVQRVTDMKLFNLEDIGPHYAPTLRLWRERFFANISKVRALGYPESFNRLWEFYLCYCEGGFAERQLGDVQMLLTKPDCRRAAIAAA